MPRKVDHQERRARIADALVRVAAERGLEAVSLRHVAAEAGVSTGMVQHYFRTKDEMMVFALDRVSENVESRLGPEPALRDLLVELLPLDARRAAEGQVALAFQAYAAVRPDVAAGLREGAARLRGFVAGLVGDARPDLDADRAATGLLALVEGLGVQVLGRQYAPGEALAVLDAHLALLLPPPETNGEA